MNQQIMYNQEYNEAIKVIKEVILQSRYTAARLVNKEMLSLYYFIGEYISKRSRIGAWGNNALDIISRQLQQELPGLRGFSVTSLKKMRTFFESWSSVFSNRPSATDENQFSLIPENLTIPIRPLTTDKLSIEDFEAFVSIGFTHHYELILQTSSIDERLFYIRRCAAEFWSVEKLKYYIADKLYEKQQMNANNNFHQTLSNTNFCSRGEFKPEYAGKLNFYLSALDEYVKLPYENPSIGIVLCKSQRQKIVEFAFRDTSKPMGVAIYKTSRKLPKAYEGILPKVDDLKTLLE